mgnify:CR=1 FL=1
MYMPEDDPEEFNVSTGFDGLALVEEDSNNAKLMDAARRGKVGSVPVCPLCSVGRQRRCSSGPVAVALSVGKC